MYMYMYMCIYICIHIDIDVDIHIDIYIYVCRYIYIYINSFIAIYIYLRQTPMVAPTVSQQTLHCRRRAAAGSKRWSRLALPRHRRGKVALN